MAISQQRSGISHLLVVAQMAGVFLGIYPPGWQNFGHPMWLLFCLAGAVAGLFTLCHNKIGNFSIYPEPKPQAVLITTGPYRFIRHPMYSSLILMIIGIAFYNSQPANFLGLGLVVIAVVGKSIIEERMLLVRFPCYAEYQLATKRFVPGIF